jgi:hypothetical protein
MVPPRQWTSIPIATKPVDVRSGRDRVVATVRNERWLDPRFGLTVILGAGRRDRVRFLVWAARAWCSRKSGMTKDASRRPGAAWPHGSDPAAEDSGVAPKNCFLKVFRCSDARRWLSAAMPAPPPTSLRSPHCAPRITALPERSGKVCMDQTSMPVLDPGRGKTGTGGLWAMARDSRSSHRRCVSDVTGGADLPGSVFSSHPDPPGRTPNTC